MNDGVNTRVGCMNTPAHLCLDADGRHGGSSGLRTNANGRQRGPRARVV
jgi:hypothetical protein